MNMKRKNEKKPIPGPENEVEGLDQYECIETFSTDEILNTSLQEI